MTTQPGPKGQARSSFASGSLNAAAFATTYRLLFALARLKVSSETYRRLADAIPLVGRDALYHVETTRAPSPQRRACWTSMLCYLYSAVTHYDGPDGTLFARVRWYLNTRRHRTGDLPAVVWSDGSALWYQLDKHHRNDDKPAFVDSNGTTEWYYLGKQHRDDDKPAGVYAGGTKVWCRNGKRHRDGDLPAIEYPSGAREWWRNGVRQ